MSAENADHLAFVVFERGDNYLGIVDGDTHRVDDVRLPGLDAITTYRLTAKGPGGTAYRLQGIWGTGPADIWAVGFSNAVLHWTGTSWVDAHP